MRAGHRNSAHRIRQLDLPIKVVVRTTAETKLQRPAGKGDDKDLRKGQTKINVRPRPEIVMDVAAQTTARDGQSRACQTAMSKPVCAAIIEISAESVARQSTGHSSSPHQPL